MDSRNEISFAPKPCISINQLQITALDNEFMNYIIFRVSSSFFFTNTSGYTSTAMRDSTVLASRVCPLMRANSIVVANLCSTDFTDFFFLLEFYIMFYHFFLFGISFLSIKNNTFSLGTISLEKLGFTFFFFKYRYHMDRVSQKFVPLISCTITFDQNFIFTRNF